MNLYTHSFLSFIKKLFGYKKNSNHFVFFIIHAAIIGPAKLIANPSTICTTAFVIPIFNSTDLAGAANNVCIRKIGIVYFARKSIPLPNFSSKPATIRITATQANSPIAKEIALLLISVVYPTMLKIINSNPNIVPCTFLPFSRTLKAQILIPSTNQISFERTVDTAYMLVPPPSQN